LRDGFVLRGRVLGEGRVVDVVVRDGRITHIRSAGATAADFGDDAAILGPTLFDIQVNGAFGASLQEPDLDPQVLYTITEKLAAEGVSHWVPTLITAPLETMENSCRVIAGALAADRRLARAVPGIHLEGPCISPEDGPRGAHKREYVRPPLSKDFDRLWHAAEGKVTYTTVAPDQPKAAAYIRHVIGLGVVVSLGHHAATAEQIGAAVDAGAAMCTHLGNGLSSQMHRHHNPLWPQLAEDRLHASLIADLHHLPPAVLRAFVRCKRPALTMLTSDAVHLAGMRAGHYDLLGMAVELRKDGKICLSGTDLLAGSSLMLLQGVVNAWRHTDLTLDEAFRSASQIPGKLFGLRHRFRMPRVGERANVVLFAPGDAPNSARVVASVVHGQLHQKR
jgi:N-acetylglucosamine-6-phosphate deacetylase